ncbi:universal stress protein [Streptomyces longispororuber]|uniref:universal stress protein n=1 Tax=Streptomyces longispororuber TaxID=68230 RepID=UPI00210B9587|nr:universal stress protein [Streptomyces longispororuber]MCQ4205691.1 universal stress protein [Streptomyces longispororuber]
MARSVVVGMDGSLRCARAADWAAREAALHGLPLRLVHVASHDARPDNARGRSRLLAGVDELTAEADVLTGSAVPRLLSLGATAELIVLAMRGAGGYAGLRVGSVALGLASACACPVVLVPSGPTAARRSRPDKVTLAIDARRPAEPAVGFALDAAHRRAARVHALHVWTPPQCAVRAFPFGFPEKELATWEAREVQLLADALRPWRQKHGHVPVLEDVFLARTPAAALIRASADAEMIVVGRRGQRALGDTASALLSEAHCPVVVVPSAP